jgi:hypothetical protein
MINTPTVFILGAGSNTNYGFPSGKELVDEICRPINRISFNDPKETTLSSEQLIKNYGIDPCAYQTFQKELIESRLSVDLFIENRPEFDEIGRKAIAINLLKCEISDRLFWGEWQYLHFENKRGKQGSESWYDLLWSHLTSPFTFDNFSNNKLAIITFNYDRSLEHFLFTALRRSSGKTDIECSDAVKTIRILHVYGSLGPLPWQDASGVPYDSQASPTAVTLSQQHIKLIRSNKHKDSSQEFEEAHILLEKATRVFILGFGFDYTNIRRLKLPQLLRDKEVWATSLGLSKSVKEVIIKGPLIRKVRKQTKDVSDIVNSDCLIDCTVYRLLQDIVSIY